MILLQRKPVPDELAELIAYGIMICQEQGIMVMPWYRAISSNLVTKMGMRKIWFASRGPKDGDDCSVHDIRHQDDRNLFQC